MSSFEATEQVVHPIKSVSPCHQNCTGTLPQDAREEDVENNTAARGAAGVWVNLQDRH
jgi:hypothetical protein